MSTDSIYSKALSPLQKSKQNNNSEKNSSTSNLPALISRLKTLQENLDDVRSETSDKDQGSDKESEIQYYESSISNIQNAIARASGRSGAQADTLSFGDAIAKNNNYENVQSSSFQNGETGGTGGSGLTNKIGNWMSSAGSAISKGIDSAKDSLGSAMSSFVSQLKGSANSNEDASNQNSNCGPTSLLMVARALGAAGGDASTADDQIEQIRQSMGGGTNEEGKEGFTSTSQLAQGAQSMGLNANEYKGNGSVGEIENQVSGGNKVIVNVNPAGYGGPNSSHFAVVSAIEGDKVILQDPLNQKPIVISKDQLAQAMSDKGNWMVAIGKGNGQNAMEQSSKSKEDSMSLSV